MISMTYIISTRLYDLNSALESDCHRPSRVVAGINNLMPERLWPSLLINREPRRYERLRRDSVDPAVEYLRIERMMEDTQARVLDEHKSRRNVREA
jgi:hypothetical protein